MRWLREVPLAVVNAHAEMLPRLQAEEDVAAATAAAAARGSKLGAWVTEWWRRKSRASAANVPAVKATAANIAAMGIAVVAAPRKVKGSS